MGDSSDTAITLTPDLDLLSAFLAEAGVHYVCGPPRSVVPALVRARLALNVAAIARDLYGRVAAAAWLESSGASPNIAIGLVAVCEDLTPVSDASRMLSLLAGEAKAHGMLQMTTWVMSDVTDPVAEFHDAGLRVVSMFNNDGSMEVVLEPCADGGC